MNIVNCPVCGGHVRSESIGWKCVSCRGFIDMQGKYHEHIDRPFMPPMTIADRIRSMSDEELAVFWSEHYDNFCQSKPECGKLLDTDEGIPSEWCVACALEYIRQPAEGADHGF